MSQYSQPRRTEVSLLAGQLADTREALAARDKENAELRAMLKRNDVCAKIYCPRKLEAEQENADLRAEVERLKTEKSMIGAARADWCKKAQARQARIAELEQERAEQEQSAMATAASKTEWLDRAVRAEKERDALQQRCEWLIGLLPDSAKLGILADWFDAEQQRDPGRWSGDSVQKDLRRWADNAREARKITSRGLNPLPPPVV